jgi:chain length determinant protein tyrosine kinase EpsG
MPMKTQENVLSLGLPDGVRVRPDRSLGAILIEEGKLSADEAERAAALQSKEGLRFGEAALRLGMITTDDLRSAVAKQYDLPHLLPENDGISSELVVAYEPFHPRSEELRALRTQLLIRWANAGVSHRVLAVASPGSGEGRSYVAANLAVMFSQLGERTLLIDADLRAPRQHRIFNVPDRIGLSAVLSGRADCSAIVSVSEFGSLSLLPAGACPPNPQELLSRPALAALLDKLGPEFDLILLDTPPAKLYADAQSVAFRAGSVMVIARKDYTRVADTTGVIRELSDTGARIVGTVFNAF